MTEEVRAVAQAQMIHLLKNETFTFLYGSHAKRTQEVTLQANQSALLRCPELGLTFGITRFGSGPKKSRIVKNIPANTKVVVKP